MFGRGRIVLPRRRRSVTEEERSLWQFVVRDADPMPGRTVPVVPVADPMDGVPKDAPEEPAVPAVHRPAGPPKTPRPSAPRPLEVGVFADMDRRTAERLRRGRLELDGRIDLHGMTQTQAHGALMGFVHRAWHEGRRCVLIITGKGNTNPDGGVLRRMVPRWLSESPVRPMVLAVQPAQPRDGGDGALYVLLKRRRQDHDGKGPGTGGAR